MLSPLARSATSAPSVAATDGPEPDDGLVAAAQADPRAFAPLYERYVARVYRYCYFRLGSRDAAEDATSDVFLRAMANLPRYRQGVFVAWLYTIARNVVADQHKARRRQQQESEPGAPTDDSGDDERQALLTALVRLPEQQRAVIELQFAGWSGEEIAASLNTSLAAVKMARYRGVARLREILDQEPLSGGTR